MKQRFTRGRSWRDAVLLRQRLYFADCRAEQRGIFGVNLASLIFRRLLHNDCERVTRVLKNVASDGRTRREGAKWVWQGWAACLCRPTRKKRSLHLRKRRISPFVVSVFRSHLRYTALRAALRTNGK